MWNQIEIFAAYLLDRGVVVNSEEFEVAIAESPRV
jgi:hypothetical protein